jgi:hypothetical protein
MTSLMRGNVLKTTLGSEPDIALYGDIMVPEWSGLFFMN